MIVSPENDKAPNATRANPNPETDDAPDSTAFHTVCIYTCVKTQHTRTRAHTPGLLPLQVEINHILRPFKHVYHIEGSPLDRFPLPPSIHT